MIENFTTSGTKDKFTTFICSLNVVMFLFLYQGTICLFFTFMGKGLENSPLTLVIRAISLGVCLLAFFLVDKNDSGKVNTAIKWLIFFWILYSIRNIYDLEFQTKYVADNIFPNDLHYYPYSFRIAGGATFQEKHWTLWLFFVPMTMIPTYVVFRTFHKIDLALCLKIARYFLFAVSFFALFNMNQVGERMDMGGSLNPISFGQFGVSIFLIGLAGKNGDSFQRDLLSYWLIIAGMIVALSSASRGAFFTLLYCAVILFFSHRPFVMTFWKTFAVVLAYLIFQNQIFQCIQKFFPGTYHRVVLGAENDYWGRGEIYWRFLQKTWDTSPWLGFQTDLFGYSHNSIVDGFMMFGFIFGWIVFILIVLCFVKAVSVFHRSKTCLWLFLIAVQYLFYGFSSGAFGNNQVLQPLLCLCFLTYEALKMDHTKEALSHSPPQCRRLQLVNEKNHHQCR